MSAAAWCAGNVKALRGRSAQGFDLAGQRSALVANEPRLPVMVRESGGAWPPQLFAHMVPFKKNAAGAASVLSLARKPKFTVPPFAPIVAS